MDKTYTIHFITGQTVEVPGMDGPVPGLALIATPCQCGTHDLYAVLHVRSGTALFFNFSPEPLGEHVWAALEGLDWSRSAAELLQDTAVTDAIATAVVRAGGAVSSVAVPPLPDVPPPVDRVIG